MYLSSSINTIDANDYESTSTVLAKAEDQLTRSGMLLNDESILSSMNNKFLSKESKLVLATNDEFDALYLNIEQTIIKIASQMRSGKADAKPLDYNGSPCRYCSARPICRKTGANEDSKED